MIEQHVKNVKTSNYIKQSEYPCGIDTFHDGWTMLILEFLQFSSNLFVELQFLIILWFLTLLLLPYTWDGEVAMIDQFSSYPLLYIFKYDNMLTVCKRRLCSLEAGGQWSPGVF